MSDEKTAVATKPASIKDLVAGDAFRKQVALCLPKHLSAERFCRIAITALTRTPKLAECTQMSFFGSLLTLSQYGLEPDGRHAHLIPYGKDCQLIIDYKGLVALMYRNGGVSNIYASVVCENDVFSFDRGQVTTHNIDFKAKRGDMYAAYAVVRMKDGTQLCDCMSKEEIDAIRKRSRASGSGPWVTDYNEMAKKTVLRRLSKLVPLPSEVADAIAADGDSARDIKQVHTIEVPAELITDGSDKEAVAVEDKPEKGAQGTWARAKANASTATKQAAQVEFDGLTDAEKKAIEEREAQEAKGNA